MITLASQVLSIVECKTSYCNFEWDEYYNLTGASFVFLVNVILNETNVYVTFMEVSYVATTYQDKEWNPFVIIFSVIVIDLMFFGGGFLG